ncbi:hypothetical protein GOV12_00205 [Candidatus Pacearchaeota archaeon]|nr:hypothetical protein [Candidatus Pacearchaeota archaeon]
MAKERISGNEQMFLDGMVDFSPHGMVHKPLDMINSRFGKDAYNCDPCDGCGPDSSFGYDSLHLG